MTHTFSRRSVTTGLAAALAAIPALGLATGAELHKLIEDRRAAYNLLLHELEKDDLGRGAGEQLRCNLP